MNESPNYKLLTRVSIALLIIGCIAMALFNFSWSGTDNTGLSVPFWSTTATNQIFNLPYMLILIASIVFTFILIFGKKGKEVINFKGGEEWSKWTYIAGLFTAGMGISLLKASGDINSYGFDNVILSNTIGAWPLYVVAGWWYIHYGHSRYAKIMTILSAVIGIGTSLAFGGATIAKLVGLGGNYLIIGVAIAVVLILAALSVSFNLLKRFSRINSILFLLGMLALIFTAKFDPLNNFHVEGTNLLDNGYMVADTAWWVSWSILVGRWIAQISNGKTVKTMSITVMTAPLLLCAIWITQSFLYGNEINSIFTESLSVNPITTIIFILTGILFLVTTLDSGTKVIADDVSSLSKYTKKQSAIKYGFILFMLVVSIVFNWIVGKATLDYDLASVANLCLSMVFFPIFIHAFINILKK